MPEFDAATIGRYYEQGWWDGRTIADMVAANALADPRAVAFIAPDAVLTWREYDELSTRMAGSFVDDGLAPGDRLAILLTGGAMTHVAYLAAQKAGLITVGLGPRAGDAEIAHILRHTGATALLTREQHRGRPAADIAQAVGAQRHLLLDPDLDRDPAADLRRAERLIAGRALGPDDLFFINSTSGTTGLPKCVRQTMNVRKTFAPLAAEAAGGLGPGDVMASVVPAPYGFGLWSQHITPARYRFPTVLVDEFDAGRTLRLIEEHRVTVLAAVTSQFIMMLNSPEFGQCDLSSLRCLFTGGERVPADRAAQFEERTGAVVLQFYGSNEAGPLSVTRADDPRDKRLTTSGRPVAPVSLRLLEPSNVVAARGPGCTPGYYADEAANEVLFQDGWQLTGDVARLDEDGYLSITGRVADFIIRGGYNVSAPMVEEAVGTHPRVAHVAVVGLPDEVFGERVCACVVTRDGLPLELDELRAHLSRAGLTKHTWPERLVCLDALPMGTGAKVDKAALRELARQG